MFQVAPIPEDSVIYLFFLFSQWVRRIFENAEYMFSILVLFAYIIERVRTIFGVDLLLTSPLKYSRDILERLYEENG